MKNIISVKNLSYKKIFSDISFNIEKGSFVAISGSNNCGKTTLIKLLSGLITTKEMIKFDSSYIEDINKTKLFLNEGIVILNEKFNFIFDKVKDEISFVLDNLDLSEDDKETRYNEVVSLLKIKKYEGLNPNTLNRKEKILVLLALSIIHKPKILFLDDICVMMNRYEKKVILDILQKLNKEWGITIVMSTTKLEEAVTADYIYIINNGNIALSGKPKEVLKDDNVINKLGLSMPFMIDLSIKLKDYDLVDDVILDMEGMVDLLWK